MNIVYMGKIKFGQYKRYATFTLENDHLVKPMCTEESERNDGILFATEIYFAKVTHRSSYQYYTFVMFQPRLINLQ
ncbi:hypothetical protein ACERII_11495 [Evansella sp. AB-rgal1]|uniref:hypothetical protein n=1 Tax=Evansella sp. AB-rgal1 TaxID=3242696 RepID=UPI00359E07F8